MLREFLLVVLVVLITGITAEDLSWWEKSIVYQVYPRSFKDSDGDGVGDLKGIISKLDYFTYLGVDSFWLSPVYKSPMKDFGYDISNYTDIDPIFGTIQDFDKLVQEAHNRSLHIIMDFVPGHTSTEHEWFIKSVNRVGNYTNYYVWDDGILLNNGTRVPPNNWLSVFGGPSWTWHETRKQYFYNAFTPQQADLNYRDENVQQEMKQVLRFWLDKGCDGFRVDAIEKLYEEKNVSLNEPVSGMNVTTFQYEYLNHIYTSNLPETIPTVASWFSVLDEYTKKDGKERYMVIELYAKPKERNKLYETGGNPFNFDLIDVTPNPTGYEIRDRVMDEYNNLPSGKWPNFVLGNHDRRRVSHKYGSQYVDVYNLLLLTLWGTPTTYYGEEIGMQEGIISWNETVDPWGRNYGQERYEEFSRDPERTPMQWTGGNEAGFTNGSKTWLPLGQNYTTINVETEKNSAKLSTLQLYVKLAQLRKKTAFMTGTFRVAYVDSNIFSYIREGGGERYLVALNVGKQNATVNFTIFSSGEHTATVIAYTPGIQGLTENSVLNLDSVKLNPGDGLLLQLKIGAAAELSWWKKSIIYQIYPRSFKDSNSDGVGDLQGIISKLDYFTYLGVDSFWLSPVYRSPMKDFGYDISNYTDIDPIFGTIQDFDKLVQEAHNKGLNIIMDFVPGHTSDQHEWFNKSVNREGNYTDYYIWNDGILLPNGTHAVPNNWLSVFGGSAWAWHETRGQFYYRAFLPEQPDLNYRNPNVQWEMKQVLKFWLDKGVDGFRVDAIEKLFEVENVSMNEPVSGMNVTSYQYEYLNHTYTSNLPETLPIVKSWFEVLDEYRQRDGKDRYMVIELYALPKLRNQLYETGGSPFNFDLIDVTPNPTGYEIRDKVMNEYYYLPDRQWPNFVLGNHDRRRVSHKYGPQYVDVYNMLLLTLWGTPTTYYGEEIGMQEGIISWEETVDPWGRNYGRERYEEFSRDPERTPMQWTSGNQAGFTDGNKTWLPLGQNYTTINVETERESQKLSTLQLYAKLASLRKKPALQTGRVTPAYVDENVFSYIRVDSGERYLVALNVGNQTTTVNFSPYNPGNLTSTVIAYTPGIQGVTENSALNLDSIKLNPGDGLLLQLNTGTSRPNSALGLRPGMSLYFISLSYISFIEPILFWAFLHSTNILTIF